MQVKQGQQGKHKHLTIMYGYPFVCKSTYSLHIQKDNNTMEFVNSKIQ